MAERATCANLVRRVRYLIADHGQSSPEVFTSDEIQDVLDVRRRRYRYAELSPVFSIAPGGAITFLEYEAGIGNWEEGAQLVDGGFNVLTPVTIDALTGRWTFSAHQKAPVFVTGFIYDLYGTAADLLERWPLIGNDTVDWKEGDVEYKYSQQRQQKLLLAEQYRQKQWVGQIQQVRSDVAGVPILENSL